MFWLLYSLFQAFIWNFSLREALFPAHPLVHLSASAVNDLVWIVPAVALPFHLFKLAGRLFSNIVLYYLFGFIIFLSLLLVGLHLTLAFRLLPLYIIAFFILWLTYIFKHREIRLGWCTFSLVLILLIIHYRLQLLPRPAPVKKSLVVMSFNNNTRRPAYEDERTIQLLRTRIPDVVFLQEVTQREAKHIVAKMGELYPHYLLPSAYRGISDVMILSRLPILYGENEIIRAATAKTGRILNHAVLLYHNQKIHVVNAHLTHPGSTLKVAHADSLKRRWSGLRRAYALQREEARLFADFVQSIDEPLIVAGDLNDTSNSYIGWRLRRQLQDAFARGGWGTGVTFGQWTMRQKLPPFLHFLAFDYLRIDHVYCSNHFRVLQDNVLKISAFDHRPQIVKLILAE